MGNYTETLERIAAALERIATALEVANVQNAPIAPNAWTEPNRWSGYVCARCGQWYSPGNTHICFGTGGGSTIQCSEPGCVLPSGHSSQHTKYTLYNHGESSS